MNGRKSLDDIPYIEQKFDTPDKIDVDPEDKPVSQQTPHVDNNFYPDLDKSSQPTKA